MAANILPERFTTGDFSAWLRHFQCCALANEWSEATQRIKLPAILQGPATSYYDSLDETANESLDALTTSHKYCFSPAAAWENFYREFEECHLWHAEDPNLFLWQSKELLHNAEPDLYASAFNALLHCQFMRDCLMNFASRFSKPIQHLHWKTCLIFHNASVPLMACPLAMPCHVQLSTCHLFQLMLFYQQRHNNNWNVNSNN